MNLKDILKRKGMSGAQLARLARIGQSDFYQALNGHRKFFPAWRNRISAVLEIPETELFPEYAEDNKEVE